jgi:glycosyltransferase involved in cell wall biosynthesis
MRILVVSSKYQPEYAGSGLRAHRTHIRLAEKYGFESEVICSSIEFNSRNRYKEDGVDIERIVSPAFRTLDRIFGRGSIRRLTNAAMYHVEARAVRKALRGRRFDLLHVFGSSPATMEAIRWARNHDVPLMVELVNASQPAYQYLPGLRHFARYSLHQNSVVVAISADLGERCRSEGLIDNVWVRPNPVDVSRFHPPTETSHSKAREAIGPFADDDVVVCYVAKFTARKNHAFLLDVMPYLPEKFKLVLAGPVLADNETEGGYTSRGISRLFDRARELGIESRVVITPGFVDTAEYLSAADVFCFPAIDEGMGTPLLESLAAAVPVVATASEPSFREWVDDNNNGILSPLKATQWADAVKAAASIPKPKMRRHAEEIVDIISTDAIDLSYAALFKELVGSKPQDTVDVQQVLATK